MVARGYPGRYPASDEMGIPADLRQFGIRHLFLAVASISIGFGLNSILPTYGLAMPLSICAFWVGNAIFTASDNLDPRPIDKRDIKSQLLNCLGILVVLASAITCIACLCLGFIELIWARLWA